MTIKHLVITGGGPYGFYSFGVLSQLKQKGVFHLKNIESIYASSIGCLVGILMVLKGLTDPSATTGLPSCINSLAKVT